MLEINCVDLNDTFHFRIKFFVTLDLLPREINYGVSLNVYV